MDLISKKDKEIFKSYFLEYLERYTEHKRLCNLSSKNERYDDNKVRLARINMHRFCYPTNEHFSLNHTRLLTLNELYTMWYIVKHNLYLDKNFEKCRKYMQSLKNIYYVEENNDLYWINTFKGYIEKIINNLKNK